MPIKRTIATEATRPRSGMTLDELATFIKEAQQAGVHGTATVKIVSTWRQSIKKIAVTG